MQGGDLGEGGVRNREGAVIREEGVVVQEEGVVIQEESVCIMFPVSYLVILPSHIASLKLILH